MVFIVILYGHCRPCWLIVVDCLLVDCVHCGVWSLFVSMVIVVIMVIMS